MSSFALIHLFYLFFFLFARWAEGRKIELRECFVEVGAGAAVGGNATSRLTGLV